MEHQYIKFIIRVSSIVLWILFILWIGTHTTPDLEHFEEKVEKSEGTIAGTASVISNLLGTKPKVEEKPKQSSTGITPEDLYIRCIRIENRVNSFLSQIKNDPTTKDLIKNIDEMIKWYKASNPQTETPSIEGFEVRAVTYNDVEKKVKDLTLWIGTLNNGFTQVRQQMDPVYNWYNFKKEQSGTPLKEAFEEETKVNAVVINPDTKPIYSPELLREQIDNLDKMETNMEIQFDLLKTDYKKLYSWYQNTMRLEREQNAKAIDQAKTAFEQKIKTATESEAVAPMPPGVSPPSGIPVKTTQENKNDITGVLTSSIESSAKTPEQQSQVAKAMASMQNI